MGTATGAAGSYYATKYTEKRQRKEAKAAFVETLTDIERQAPKFFDEVREDYQNPENVLKREFYVLKKGTHLNAKGTFLVYYRDDHPNINDILKFLESEGMVWETTQTNATKYQFSNEFIKYIRNEI